MVRYNEWVGIVFDYAKSQGHDATFETNAQVIQVAADIWNDRKQSLANASASTARKVAEEEVNVS